MSRGPQILKHACSVGDINVPFISDENAKRMVRESLERWNKVGSENGWQTKAVIVWVRPDGTYRDSLYMGGEVSHIVLDTHHDHAGEECGYGHEILLHKVPSR